MRARTTTASEPAPRRIADAYRAWGFVSEDVPGVERVARFSFGEDERWARVRLKGRAARAPEGFEVAPVEPVACVERPVRFLATEPGAPAMPSAVTVDAGSPVWLIGADREYARVSFVGGLGAPTQLVPRDELRTQCAVGGGGGADHEVEILPATDTAVCVWPEPEARANDVPLHLYPGSAYEVLEARGSWKRIRVRWSGISVDGWISVPTSEWQYVQLEERLTIGAWEVPAGARGWRRRTGDGTRVVIEHPVAGGIAELDATVAGAGAALLARAREIPVRARTGVPWAIAVVGCENDAWRIPRASWLHGMSVESVEAGRGPTPAGRSGDEGGVEEKLAVVTPTLTQALTAASTRCFRGLSEAWPQVTLTTVAVPLIDLARGVLEDIAFARGTVELDGQPVAAVPDGYLAHCIARELRRVRMAPQDDTSVNAGVRFPLRFVPTR